MKIFNEQSFQHKKYTVFVLTYLGIDYFMKWSKPLQFHDDIQFVLLDNGMQGGVKDIETMPVYQTSRNIGCAGGWNLQCQIAFNRLGLDKIIIAQDDSIINDVIIKSIWESTTDDTIAGAYDRSFEFAVYGITKNYWNQVGMFDENFIYAGCEDNDYKHRSKLVNKRVISLNYSADLNQSLSSKLLGEQLQSSNHHNAEYIKQKWGEQYEFTHPFNDKHRASNNLEMGEALQFVYDNPENFPSILEYKSI
jgi:hypothetical protein